MILCVNAGSSSLKLSIRSPESGRPEFTGAVEGIGTDAGRTWFRDGSGNPLVDEAGPIADRAAATARALDALGSRADAILAVGHRVVHGGRTFTEPVRIDDDVVDALTRLIPLAPLHLPPQLAAIAALRDALPTLSHVACFDTAFHRAMPEPAQRFALPEWAWEDGLCRYGFHGLSYENAVDRLGPGCGRVVIAHLGNGASMAAVHDGRPIDTTMAYTPAAGLIMGTRTGDLDPGLVVHLIRECGMSADGVDRLINHESGLLGISGTTSDMRALLDRRHRDPRADLAVTMFCRSARMHTGALAAALGGIDQLVFTGGIGERSPDVRAEICSGLAHLGIRLDAGRNSAGADRIDAGGPCAVKIIGAEEDRMISRHTAVLTRS